MIKEKFIKVHGFEYYIRKYRPQWLPFFLRHYIVDKIDGQPLLYKKKNGKFVPMISKEVRDS